MDHVVLLVLAMPSINDCIVIDIFQLLFHKPSILNARTAVNAIRCQDSSVIVVRCPRKKWVVE